MSTLCLDVSMNTLLETPMTNPTSLVSNIMSETNVCVPASIVYEHAFTATQLLHIMDIYRAVRYEEICAFIYLLQIGRHISS